MKKDFRLTIPNKPTGSIERKIAQTRYMAHCPYCCSNQIEPNIIVDKKKALCPTCGRDLIIDKVISPANYLLEALNSFTSDVMQRRAANEKNETAKEVKPIIEFYKRPIALAIAFILGLGASVVTIISFLWLVF